MSDQFFWGVLATACLVVAMFFLKFWTASRDRLFVWFGIAFAILGIHWIGLAVLNPLNESRHYLFIGRLVAFLAILGGIIDKNRHD